jgi:hypothetical protein
LWRIGAGWWDTIVVEPPIGGAGEHSDTEWYTLKLVVTGSNFRGYVNNELIFETQDDAFKGEFVGIGMGLFTDASFDDFVVTDETLASVSPQGALITTWAGLKK